MLSRIHTHLLADDIGHGELIGSVSVVADNVEIRNVKSVSIKMNNSIKFKLLYDRNNSLSKKIKLEQIRKQTI